MFMCMHYGNQGICELCKNSGCIVFGRDRTLNDVFLGRPGLTLVFVMDDGELVLTGVTGIS